MNDQKADIASSYLENVKEIDFNTIRKDVSDGINVIYGGGYNGKLLYEMLDNKSVPIEAFYDDDKSRWGEEYCGKKILSIDELMVLNKDTTNIFISSMYIGQIEARIRQMGFNKIFAALDMLLKKDTDDFKFYDYQNNQSYIDDLEYLIEKSQDKETRKYFEVIRKTVLSGKAINEIVGLYCGEKQYFLSCLKGKLDRLNFVDAGAYTGDTVRALIEEDIHPAGVYCFEADYSNYKKLEEFKEKNGRISNLVCENYALWDIHTKLGIKFANYNARIDLDSEKADVETTTIDDYFENIKVGFIKMDIEGAEKKAIAGGMKVIKRDRPILAISIYHGLDDIVDIPKMLMCGLENYKFMVRHHSYTYSETVLYGIPNELDIL